MNIINDNSHVTFLSEDVFEMVVTLATTPCNETDTCLNNDLLFNWDAVDEVLGNLAANDRIFESSEEWFYNTCQSIWSIVNLAHNKFMESSIENRARLLPLCHWIDELRDFDLIVNNHESLTVNDVLLILLKLTSRVERRLGDVYSASGMEVPFLLRDLLASEYLEQQLGKIQTKLLQLLMGCVQGLNLRNIAWHGFFSPGEINGKILSFFLILVASLGKQLAYQEFPPRPCLTNSYMEKYCNVLKRFYSNINFGKSNVLKLIQSSNYISRRFWSSWEFAMNLFLTERYHDSLIFLMPLFENLLRTIYCFINNCSERLLTAESSVYYITLDDTLKVMVTETVENKLKNIIGMKLYEMLLDLFIYQEGPRLRDKISHSEFLMNTSTEELAKYTFGLSMSIIVTINQRVYKDAFESELYLIPENYVPLYHPSSLLVKTMLHTVDDVSEWNKSPVPLHLPNECNDEDFLNIQETVKKIKIFEFTNISNLLTKLKDTLESTFPSTVNRSKLELELISLLRRIVSNIKELHVNLTTNARVKFDQWTKKEMKSRIRNNYERMLICVPLLQFGVTFIICCMATTLMDLYENSTTPIKCFLRSYKIVLQYVENAVTMSSIKRNRWAELRVSTIKIVKSIEQSEMFRNSQRLHKLVSRSDIAN